MTDQSNQRKPNVRNIVKIGGAALAVIVAIIIVLLLINILQRGVGGWNGETAEEILGKPAAQASLVDLEALSKAELMQLFYAADAPAPNNLRGEYDGKNLPVGILFCVVRYFEINVYGPPGEWRGKAFQPCDREKCPGDNYFETGRENGHPIVEHGRKMDVYLTKSAFDDKQSLMIDYSPYNEGLMSSLRDELRRINDTLYIGMGYLTIPGGTLNCFPFALWRDK